jgi:hypothetical protein
VDASRNPPTQNDDESNKTERDQIRQGESRGETGAGKAANLPR